MLSIEEVGSITRSIRAAANKYMIKIYLLNCVYFAYLYNVRDSTKYMNRYILSFSVSPVSIYNNTALLIKFKLIEKVTNDIYLLTDLSKEICSFINNETDVRK